MTQEKAQIKREREVGRVQLVAGVAWKPEIFILFPDQKICIFFCKFPFPERRRQTISYPCNLSGKTAQ